MLNELLRLTGLCPRCGRMFIIIIMLETKNGFCKDLQKNTIYSDRRRKTIFVRNQSCWTMNWPRTNFSHSELNHLSLVNYELHYQILNNSAQLLKTMKQCAKPDSNKLKIGPSSYSLERKTRIRPFSKNERIIFKRICLFEENLSYTSRYVMKLRKKSRGSPNSNSTEQLS